MVELIQSTNPTKVSCILLGAGDPTGDKDGHQEILGGSSWAAGNLVHFWALRPYSVTWIGALRTSPGSLQNVFPPGPCLESCTGLPKGSLGHPESPLTCSHIPPRTNICNAGCAKNSCTRSCKFKTTFIPNPSEQCQKDSPLLFVHVNNKILPFFEIICTEHSHETCDHGAFSQFQVLR